MTFYERAILKQLLKEILAKTTLEDSDKWVSAWHCFRFNGEVLKILNKLHKKLEDGARRI